MESRIWCLVVCVNLCIVCLGAAVSSSSTSHATSSTHNGSHTSRTTSAQTRSVYSQHVTSSEAVSHRANETIYNTTLKYGDVVGVNTTKYPYRVCSMAQGTDLIRFERNIICTSMKPINEDLDEGIMVVYKRNIVAHTFKVRVYQKVLTFRRSYAYIYTTYLLGSNTEYVAPPMWEIHHINKFAQCYSSYSRVIGGTVFVAYHRDSYENKTMQLIPDDYSNTHSTRYVTVKDQWHSRGSTWLYRETCNLNCMLTITTARSKYPYHFFATSTGDVVDISPFYNGTNRNASYFGENADKFFIFPNYTIVSDFGRPNAAPETHRLVAFLERADSVISWDIQDEKNVTCQLTFWEASERTIRSEAEDSYHFSSAKMTATFLSKKQEVNMSDSALDCVRDEAINKLQQIFNTSYNQTYEKYGNVSVFETSGGLVVFWQGIKQKSLVELERLANRSSLNITHRTRRSTSDNNTTHLSSMESVHNLVYAQLQFTYDTLRGYINRALAQIAEAWCVDQRRTLEVFKELSKINPSAILSAIYNKPIAARFMGDVLGLASCVTINQTSVKVLRDMNVKESPGRCYSRPVVIFNFANSSYVQYGQLGEDNEILLGNHRTEECQLPSLKIFIAGNSAYEYVDYLFKRMIDLSSISTVDSMIALDIDPLENTDFRVLELYSQKELRSSNVFDLEEIMREFNSYKQRVKYVEDKVVDPLPPYLKGLDDLMSGLGAAGKAVGVAIGAVGGAVASVVEGVATFLKNPFGAFTIILVAIAVVIITYLIYTRQRRLCTQPLQNLFPYLVSADGTTVTSGSTKDTSLQAPPSYEESVYNSGRKGPGPPSSDASTAAPPYTNEQAYQMLLALARLDAEQRAQQNGTDSLDGQTGTQDKGQKPNLLDRLRHRKNGYRHLKDSDEEENV
ncbi:envelope glycoprotein B [Human betaherpesvirus 5]|uniref:Envelope glycoprotein B n=2 Tax=Human cytomegalovirus TaxID=10359 RepID=V9LLT5_HCMVM|nr:envelope glycoprotein B [Human betaherpesvirus 5]AFR55385.1 envelope glycoprotein B [Human betaherpesvirus 5]AHJ85651.1 envelope glycoprotein B [Human betaherpesvirus 5]AKI07779.1 envelope glycoprotein B [Human betaherpesvirus 5]AKI08447.1 envelope glycoprotein B [Human betaherpesvirus 5]